ncbi:MAG: hypothetical protein LBH19_11650 [Dysgonamonadaceae bacterium]|jgi:hypothetical protein|nr:hypothetical protein [Dysgonamonadaceae bacterium]
MKLKNLFQADTRPPGDPFAREEPDVCCGRHPVCRKELLLKAASNPAEYYDDEELDVFAGRSSDSYNEEETGQFAEVLSTMPETDVAGWMYSLQLREIKLPDDLQEEVLMIMSN